MEKILDATYDGEVFRPDEPVDLPSDTKVKVIIEEEPKKLKLVEMPKKGKGEPYAFLRYARSVSIDAPPDFASNIDEYLYGGKSLDDE
ncbi:MAG: antitoxin family protein [Pyrinomonadaceae bacterium]